MRKLMSTFVALLSIATCFASCTPATKGAKSKPMCAEWIKPDSIAYNQLGRRMAEILFAPQKVRCFSAKPKANISNEDIRLDGEFVRDSLLAVLTNEQIAVLQYTLFADSANYHKDSVIVMSPYLPYLEFEFSKKKETLHVLISTSDFSWAILYDDKRQFRYNYAETRLIGRYCQFFLDKIESLK